ncbi:MAG: hypothetical protein KGY54_09575 [Oleiphilaceae bacterium]|nr:hypothetical protein [Oleiphilaceae bacterium]
MPAARRKAIPGESLEEARFLASVEVEELMFTIDIYDPEKRCRALDILAASCA